MVLIGLGVGWACKRWMHTPDHSFEGQHVEKMENSMSQGSAGPSKHFLFGFRDRDLEDEYLDYLMRESRVRIYLGYVVMLLLMFFTFVPDFIAWFYYLILVDSYMKTYGDLEAFPGYGDGMIATVLPALCALIIPIVGLIASYLIYRGRSNKRVVLHGK